MAGTLKLNVVQVDKRHQKTSLRLLLEAVRSSSFIALDLELSGLGDKRGLNTRYKLYLFGSEVLEPVLYIMSVLLSLHFIALWKIDTVFSARLLEHTQFFLLAHRASLWIQNWKMTPAFLNRGQPRRLMSFYCLRYEFL